jgi:hypothetical protein
MSNQPPFSRRPVGPPTVPRGDVLGTYETYQEAQQVVEKLSRSDFDVRQLAIVGSDLKSIERVTGKMSYPRAALGGAATGAWFGLFAGILLFTFTTSPNYTYAFAVILFGAALGMLYGLARYAITRRTRDYTSTQQVIASSYQVLAPSNLIVRAQELLQRPEV